MKVTVDANVLFSCLIKDGVTRHVWFSPSINLYAPEFLVDEFKKYGPLLLKKYGGGQENFTALSEKILGIVEFTQDKDLAPFLPAASSLLQDKKDVLYLACALREDTIIWSNDKGFKKQRRIEVKNTAEMVEEFGML